MEQIIENQFCYDPTWETKQPPFHLAIDPVYFQLAQLSCVDFKDTFLIKSLQKTGSSGMFIADYYLYEKAMMKDMSFLCQVVFPSIEDSQYSRIGTVLSIPLANLIDTHTYLISQMQEAMQGDPKRLVSEVIQCLVKTQNLVDNHHCYTSKLTLLHPLDISFSNDLSTKFSKGLSGKPLIQALHEPTRWYIATKDFCRHLISTFSHTETIPSSLEQLITRIEDCTSELDWIPKLEQVSHMFLKEPFQIVKTGRTLIRIGKAFKQCRKVLSERTIILFSDYFVYAQPKGSVLMIPAVYDLEHLRVEIPNWDIIALCLYAPRKSFVLQFRTVDERNLWGELISSAIANVKEGKSEINSYPEAPIWVPDNTHNTCELCHTAYSFFTRRHHCRKCGLLGCNSCLSSRIVIENISSKPVRVCKTCYEFIQQEKKRGKTVESTFYEEETDDEGSDGNS